MRYLAVCSLMLILAGCGNAKWVSIYRPHKFSDAHDTQSALVDAKQRAIISSPASGDRNGDGLDDGPFIVCAEPSPDAVSALSSALSTSLGVDIAGQGSGKGSLAFALTEAVGKLGKRNATIQLLCDGFYRQCEAYLNGVINEASFVKVSNRYVDAMVTLLAIEQVISPTAGDAPLVIRASTTSADTEVNGQPVPSDSSPPPNGFGTQSDQNPEDNTPPPTEAASANEANTPDGGGGSGNEKRAEGKARTGVEMEVELSDLRSSENDQGVAAEVRSMVSIFLDKDSRDRCLDRIGRFADRFEFGDEPSDDEKKLIDNFTQLCFDVIRTSVGAHIWRPSADDAGKASPGPTGGVPPSPIQPRLLVP